MGRSICRALLLGCILSSGRSVCFDSSFSCAEEKRIRNEHLGQTHVFKDAIPLLSSRSDLHKGGQPDDNYLHEVIFVIQSRNVDELTRIVDDVSDPESTNYGHHMTREQVAELTSNPESSAAVSAYLHANGAAVTSVTLGEEFVTAQAPISVWERLLKTRFYVMKQTHRNGESTEVVRAEEYWLPKEIHPHVTCVMNTVEMPIIQTLGKSSAIDAESLRNRRLVTIPGLLHDQLVTPARLRIYYNMSNSHGNSLSTQVVFSGSRDYFSPLSLRYFQGNVSMQPFQPAIIEVNDGHATDDPSIPEGDLGEGNLDMQYIMAMSPGSPTTYWHYTEGIARFIRDLAGKPRPSLVASISYALTERAMSAGEYRIYEEWILKASAMGVTVFSASGDQGANGGTDGTISSCRYDPSYPNSNPYTVSVGATTGALRYAEEVVCAWSNGQAITSGGGFSYKYSRPAYQDAAMAKYVAEIAQSAVKPVTGYNALGRGYPDVAFEGHMYRVQHRTELSSKWSGTSGTSASTPVAAGMFSNINAARLAAGKGSIGWVNPVLYKHSTRFVNDITKGSNLDGLLCPQGFYATPGWDPATGLGSINYGKFEEFMLSLGTANSVSSYPSLKPAAAPSMIPTSRPSSRPSLLPPVSPSLTPSVSPRMIPTSRPSSRPSLVPSSIPSVSPRMIPTSRPSSRPSLVPSSIPSVSPRMIPTSRPSSRPSLVPSSIPSVSPRMIPTSRPSSRPSLLPSSTPSVSPRMIPTSRPSSRPSLVPSSTPSVSPRMIPTSRPSSRPSLVPSSTPSVSPSMIPTSRPSSRPSLLPSSTPSSIPSASPRMIPTSRPSSRPSLVPSSTPSVSPRMIPTSRPSSRPSLVPSSTPSVSPSIIPTSRPSSRPPLVPSSTPSVTPSMLSSLQPTSCPTGLPSGMPSSIPSVTPSMLSSLQPTSCPTGLPSAMPSETPSMLSSLQPTSCPTGLPSAMPSSTPSVTPSMLSSLQPTSCPTGLPSVMPSPTPSVTPSMLLLRRPTSCPTVLSSASPSSAPSVSPSRTSMSRPTRRPTALPSKRTVRPSRHPSMKRTRTRTPSRHRSAKPSKLPLVAPSKKRMSRSPTLPFLKISAPFVPPTVTCTSRPTEPTSVALPASTATLVPSFELSSSAASSMPQSPLGHPSVLSGAPLRDLPTCLTENCTATPSRRRVTSIVYLQVVADLTESEVLISSILRAVIESVSEVLVLSPGAVTAGDAVIGSRRSLLSSVSMLFTLTVDSDMASAAIIRELQQAISSGTFFNSLSNKSSPLVTRVTSITVSDAPPQSSRIASSGLHSNLEEARPSPSSIHNVYIAIGAIGALLAVLLGGTVWYHSYRKRHRRSPVHSKDDESSETDMIPNTQDDSDLVNAKHVDISSHQAIAPPQQHHSSKI